MQHLLLHDTMSKTEHPFCDTMSEMEHPFHSDAMSEMEHPSIVIWYLRCGILSFLMRCLRWSTLSILCWFLQTSSFMPTHFLLTWILSFVWGWVFLEQFFLNLIWQLPRIFRTSKKVEAVVVFLAIHFHFDHLLSTLILMGFPDIMNSSSSCYGTSRNLWDFPSNMTLLLVCNFALSGPIMKFIKVGLYIFLIICKSIITSHTVL